MAFYPVSPRTAGHGVRCTLLALRLSAQQLTPAHHNYEPVRRGQRDAVRWLDTHCHLNAIAHCWSHRHVHA
ncbi:hypothetical protein [Aeromonas enteropelogenes]|uniref:hypothetical protein n=1 Tax=Aeromonas enteropelogenes TaxID=29489 RepID=UPI003B9E7109